jgi:Tfp pilus assembly protein PilX
MDDSTKRYCTGKGKQGSALVIVVLFVIVVGLTASAILKFSMHERAMASHSIELASIMNLAEQGAERAIWAINNDDWSGWSTLKAGSDYYLPYTEAKLDNGTETGYHVLVQSASATPIIHTEGISENASGKQLTKQLRISYTAASDSDGAGGGMIAKGSIDLGGQPIIDAYNSAKGPPHPFFNHLDSVIVASISKDSDALKLSGQVDIYGYAGTGKKKPEISGPGNKILGEDSEGGINVDWSRVSQDFTFDFPEVVEPSWSGAKKSIPEAKNKTVTLGNRDGTLVKYDAKELKLSGNSNTKYQIIGPVEMRLSDGVSISGQATIEIAPGGSLDIYTSKDVNISGQGIVNKTSRPKNMRIYGTVNKEKDQTMSLSGQGLIEAVFYMPNAVINISGQGDIAGSVIGYEIKQSGQGNFHYDVTLGGDSDDGDPIGNISAWHELIKDEHQLDLLGYARDSGYLN